MAAGSLDDRRPMSTPATRFKVFANLYKDSVTLMQLGAQLREREGVAQASCLMATPANLAQLQHADLVIDAQASPSDLVVVVRGDPEACQAAIDAADATLLAKGGGGDGGAAAFSLPLTSIALGVEHDPDADLALISVPGDYAAAEAMKALALGLHVMLFSDNVAIDEERAIKTAARAKELLVMGPDCGTAIVNGDSARLRQRRAARRHRPRRRFRHRPAGGHVPHPQPGRRASRRRSAPAAAICRRRSAASRCCRALAALADDPTDACDRPDLEAAGAGDRAAHRGGRCAAQASRSSSTFSARRRSARAAACSARSRCATRQTWRWRSLAATPERPRRSAPADAATAAIEACATAMAPRRRQCAGLFTGGTFCYEAQLAFIARGLACRSNAPAKGAAQFDGRFDGHVFLDLGDDDYTRGRPHPMIDPTLRDAAMRAQGADAQTAAILFDVVLGFGAHADPASGLAQALADAAARSACPRPHTGADRPRLRHRRRPAGQRGAGSTARSAPVP